MRTELWHISWSCLDSFDNYRDDFYNSYVLGIETEYNEHMKFWKDYEDWLAMTRYDWYDRQHKIEEYIEWYKIVWYCDFVNDNEVVEAKTKSWWRSENNIRNSRQFRIYNHYRWDKKFIIHQYNKKRQEEKIQDIWWDDENFIADMLSKIKELEQYLSKYNVKVLTYDINNGEPTK